MPGLYFLAASLLVAAPVPEGDPRPNIVLLFADDLGRYASAYRNPDRPSPNDLIETPVFDRLAREGARFDQAFVSAPSCTPSRAALYTGRHFFRNGSHSQLHHPWPKGDADPFDDVIGMPRMLLDNGYHAGWSHKWHMRESLIGGKSHRYDRAGRRINSYSQQVSKADDPATAKAAILSEVRENFRDFLADRDDGQQFFYSFNPTNTHRTWVRGSGAALWGLDPSALEGKMPPFLPDNETVREDLADYLGEAMAFDAACGVIINELRTRELLDDTLVCITGDHGIPGFTNGKCNVYDFGARVSLAMRLPNRIDPGRVVVTPVSLVDLAPTFLEAAGVSSSPADSSMNGESLLPAVAPGGTDDDLRGWALIGREVHVGNAREGGLPYPVRALRTKDHLYIWNFKPDRWPMGDPKGITAESTPPLEKIAKNTRTTLADMDASPTRTWLIEHRNDDGIGRFYEIAFGLRPMEELYVLADDPLQQRNVVDDPALHRIHFKLRDQLLIELERNQDPRLAEDAFDRPPYAVGP